MELNDESADRAPSGAGDGAAGRDETDEAVETVETDRTVGPAGEAEIEAAIEAEIEADVASYESELAGENAAAEVEVEKEAVAGEAPPREYPRSYEPPTHPIAKRESLLKRLRPYYLTAAGLLLIARIVVYSLRRRRR